MNLKSLTAFEAIVKAGLRRDRGDYTKFECVWLGFKHAVAAGRDTQRMPAKQVP